MGQPDRVELTMDWDKLQRELKRAEAEPRVEPVEATKPKRLPRKAAQAKWEKPQG